MTDERTNGGGKWKIGQCSVGPETAIKIYFALLDILSDEDDIKVNRVLIMKRKEAFVCVDHL